MKIKLLAASIFACLLALPGSATTIFTVQNVTAPFNTFDNLIEVDLTNAGPSSINVAGFSFGVMITGISQVTFTSVSINTLQPYIFAGNSLFGPNIIDPPGAGTAITASDLHDTSFTTVAAGATVGLGVIHFSTGANIGTYAVDLFPVAAQSLADASFVSITVDQLTSGSITTVTPEPATWSLFAAGLLAFHFGRKKFQA